MFGEGLHSLQELVEESQRVLGVEHPTVSSEVHGKIASVITNGYGGSQPLISKSRCSCSSPSVKGSVVKTEVAHRASLQHSGPARRCSIDVTLRIGSTQSTEAFKQTTNRSPLKGAVIATLAQNDDSPGDSGGRVLSERLDLATLCVDRTDGIAEGHKTAVQN